MNTKSKWKSFSLLTGSILIMAVGIYFFKFANNFTFGGITGLAVLVAKTGVMSASDFTFLTNMLLLLLGFIVLGKKFGLKTAYCSTLLSVTLSLLERIYPMSHPLTDQPMLELTFAIALPAFGSAILFIIAAMLTGIGIGVSLSVGGSTGGTDIIAAILKKYSDFNIGRALLLTDLVITIAGCFVFDIETGLYSFLGLAVRSLMIDNVIESFNLCKYFNVVCDNPEPICDFIMHELHRSATTCEAKGAFSGEPKSLVFTVLNRHQAIRLRNYIKEVEPTAFILISNTSEIIGKGFHNTI